MLEFSSEKVVGKVTIEVDITEENIENIIVTALEGGCNYWLGIICKKAQFADKPKGEPTATWVTKLLLEGQEIECFDVEDTTEPHWTLTLEKLLKGITLHVEERPEFIDIDDWDADNADCAIQCALFGKLVYS